MLNNVSSQKYSSHIIYILYYIILYIYIYSEQNAYEELIYHLFIFKYFIFDCAGSSLLQAAFSSDERGYSLVAVRGLFVMASFVAKYRL